MTKIKKLFWLACFFCVKFLSAQPAINIISHAPMPEKLTNNAVCEGFIGNHPYVYTFGGIDTSLIWSGISRHAYRYDVWTDVWDTLPDLPDSLGKIASAASRIHDTIYIIGGYHVFQNGNETSSSRVHRFCISTNAYLSDGAPLPHPIDDQVQVVWRDSLIYVITGWSNVGNVSYVQVYDARTNTWAAATNVPNNGQYKAFGASGVLIDDTIYYYGGANTSLNFPAQSWLRKGAIDPQNPLQITWLPPVSLNNYTGYRTAAMAWPGFVSWIGGSSVSYNFDGVAYNGSGIVSPTGNEIFIGTTTGQMSLDNDFLPMDLRGTAVLDTTTKFIVGGMWGNQQLAGVNYELRFSAVGFNEYDDAFDNRGDLQCKIYPNPADAFIFLKWDGDANQQTCLELIDAHGRVLETHLVSGSAFTWSVQAFENGYYSIRMSNSKGTVSQKIILLR
jgi:hypothetical protein